MKKSILSFSCAIGLSILGFSQPAFGGRKTISRTGPNGNSQETIRTFDDGLQATNHTGSNGNLQVTTRTFERGE